ncbi:MAG: hypothetical protein QM808_00355 [Steroidobacteraceae bacterium]
MNALVIMRLAAIFLSFAVVWPLELMATEEDIFDSDTFVDPRDFGTELQTAGAPTAKGKFSFSDVQAGYVRNYQDRSLNTHDNVDFLSIAHYRYLSAWQFSGKVTGFGEDFSGVRSYLAIGRYKLSEDPSGADPFVSRMQLGLTVDSFQHQKPEFEVSGDLFVQVPGLSASVGRGGIVYSYRFKEGPNIWRLQWKSSFDVLARQWGGANLAFWVGYENRDDHGRFTPIKSKFTIARRIGRKTQLDFAVAPTYQFQSRGFDAGMYYEAYVGMHRIF